MLIDMEIYSNKSKSGLQRDCIEKLLLAGKEKHRGDYLTAPATALVKLFCRRKKMMIVGREQRVTPAITTP